MKYVFIESVNSKEFESIDEVISYLDSKNIPSKNVKTKFSKIESIIKPLKPISLSFKISNNFLEIIYTFHKSWNGSESQRDKFELMYTKKISTALNKFDYETDFEATDEDFYFEVCINVYLKKLPNNIKDIKRGKEDSRRVSLTKLINSGEKALGYYQSNISLMKALSTFKNVSDDLKNIIVKECKPFDDSMKKIVSKDTGSYIGRAVFLYKKSGIILISYSWYEKPDYINKIYRLISNNRIFRIFGIYSGQKQPIVAAMYDINNNSIIDVIH